jgi:hypothetical protein
VKKRLSALIAVMIVSSGLLAACGSDNGGSSATDGRASVEAKLFACLKQAKIRVVPSGKVDVAVQGRVPRVPVPAEYLGAAVFPTSGFYDLWLAGDSDSAQAAVNKLNEALSQKLDAHPRVVASRDLAFAYGPAVAAPGGNVEIDNPSEILTFLGCLKRL